VGDAVSWLRGIGLEGRSATAGREATCVRSVAAGRVESVLARAGVRCAPEVLTAGVARVGAVALNFHPDRIAADGRMVTEALLADGVYRSQFATGISNGGPPPR